MLRVSQAGYLVQITEAPGESENKGGSNGGSLSVWLSVLALFLFAHNAISRYNSVKAREVR
ncbi:hypothetical protein [Saccharospirillum impatiens]|uniref:hypothetical protein n=1 Tax=Saccharospirillum impatiens TaxID=169438 RepID=UPI000416B2CF|nr:hypothetical protein [Saccharospirillum impatiens]